MRKGSYVLYTVPQQGVVCEQLGMLHCLLLEGLTRSMCHARIDIFDLETSLDVHLDLLVQLL